MRENQLSAIVENGQSAWPDRLKLFISRWQFLLLTPNEIGQPTSRRRTGGLITLNKDGSNIAEYLLDIRNLDLRYGTTAFNSIIESLQYILDYARDLQPTVTSELERMVYLQLTEGEAKIPGWLLSSGTLRLVSLLAVLRHPQPPPLIVIEEVENGLDPRTVQLIAKEIKGVVQSGQSQVVLSTHSPSLLDLLDLSNIVLVKRGEQGPTFYPPTDNKSLRVWAHSYGLGHLYLTNTLMNFAYEGEEAETVKRIELGLRELIDTHLAKQAGPQNYWKQYVPGDVKARVKKRIDKQLNQHPYLDKRDFYNSRRRLDFL
ncbi:MAG: ATP-binding protein [Ardenticatenales bacterium]|nr:ATP-binding protein [Ardenticatenales bacterium]